jgi:hypothetical protein
MAEKYFGHAPRELRAAAVARYLRTDLTLEELGEQSVTSRSNVSRWVLGVRLWVGRVNDQCTHDTGGAKRRKEGSAVGRSSQLSEAELGEFLRRNGLRHGDLERFKAVAMGGLRGEVHGAVEQRRMSNAGRAKSCSASTS